MTIGVDRLASAPDVELSGPIEIRSAREDAMAKGQQRSNKEKKKPKQKKVAPPAASSSAASPKSGGGGKKG